MIYLTAPLTTLLALALATSTTLAQTATLTVDTTTPGPRLSPNLYGIFYEEINRAGDGGLWAEMLENRSFEAGYGNPAWQVTGSGKWQLDTTHPARPRNLTALRIEPPNSPSHSGETRLISRGFRPLTAGSQGVGLAVTQSAPYRAAFLARTEGNFSSTITLRLRAKDGKVLAESTISNLTDTWQQYTTTLTPSETTPTATFELAVQGKGALYLDMVSLAPEKTWKNSGLREDLATMIADLKPAFVRFPGGCFVEGNQLANRHQWKLAIGDPANRASHPTIWGYPSPNAFGFHECLVWCENLNAEPLYVINCGMAHEDWVGGPALDAYIQDALDAIEYATGDVSTPWGKKRAEAGHPAPFQMNYIQIGNENGGPIYAQNYARFHDAIKAKYPHIKLIANDWHGIPDSRPLDIIDEHYYGTPQFLMEQASRYDTYDRKGPKIYVGEYAVTREGGAGNLIGAIAEAAFMAGMERNADIVAMGSYAPLFCNVIAKRWPTNAINFDQSRVYGTPSYHIQKTFAHNRPDTILPITLIQAADTQQTLGGTVGFGTWATQAEFKDIKVTQGDKTLYEQSASSKVEDFKHRSGTWSLADGVFKQSDTGEGNRLLLGDSTWSNYTVSLKARKLAGEEGFLICFQNQGAKDRTYWNLGGWGNTRTAVQIDGQEYNSTRTTIESNRWYDIRVECQDTTIRCYLDGKLFHTVTRKPVGPLFASAGKTDNGDIILKVINGSPKPATLHIDLKGLSLSAATTLDAITLTGDPQAENALDNPTRLTPKTSTLTIQSPAFDYQTQPTSATVLRLKASR